MEVEKVICIPLQRVPWWTLMLSGKGERVLGKTQIILLNAVVAAPQRITDNTILSPPGALNLYMYSILCIAYPLSLGSVAVIPYISVFILKKIHSTLPQLTIRFVLVYSIYHPMGLTMMGCLWNYVI